MTTAERLTPETSRLHRAGLALQRSHVHALLRHVRRSRRTTGTSAALLIVTGVSIVTALAVSRFVPTDLGTLGGSMSYPLSMNDAGVTVGYSQLAGSEVNRAFRRAPGRGMHDLGTLGGRSSLATAVSDKGVVVGASDMVDDSSHAFGWTERAGMIDLGTLPAPFSNSYATGVSRNALVIGFSWKTIEDYATHGFAWTRAHGMVDIGTFGGDTYPNAVNEHGLVVGTAYTQGNQESRPFAWTRAGGMVDLDPRRPLR